MQTDIALGYSGSYERFSTPSKKEASALVGADNLVGDRFSIEFKTVDGTTTAWMKNKFGALVGSFDQDVSRQLQIYHARGWTLVALLSFVAYTNTPKPGEYWGEAALICYDPQRNGEAFDAFVSTIGSMMQTSLRPDVSLGKDGIDHVVGSQGSWKPSARVPLPEQGQETMYLKSQRSVSERLIEQGRAGNKGCYVFSWAFIALLAVAVVAGAYFFVKSLGLI